MSDKKTNVKIMQPDSGDAVSVRNIPSTPEDRAQHLKEFRDDQKHKDKLKDERFAKIAARRKNRPPSGSGGGINIEVTGD